MLQYTPTEIERFWAKVQKSDSCWITNATPSQEYGLLSIGGRLDLMHRISYRIHYGSIPPGLQVAHNCPGGDNKRCVNPDHLMLLSFDEHLKDRMNKRQLAMGDSSGARLHPERLPRGDSHGSKLHPERIARGDRHGSHVHPERIARGEQQGNAVLTQEDVRFIRNKTCTRKELAARFNVNISNIDKILARITWRHIP